VKREWKPGDVKVVEVQGKVRILRYRPPGAEDAEWPWVMDQTYDRDDYIHSNWTGFEPELRPLVVIDPEDREQVERLEWLYVNSAGDRPDSIADRMQAALREFTEPKPPKPEEPTGLGAVVECDPGPVYDRAWAVRVWAGDDFGGKAWDYYDSSGNGGRCHYADLAVVRVLSEGVTA
jgi:hypothetical protein